VAIVVDKLPQLDVSPDPDDNYLLALAETGQAQFLVTGDKELLSLKRHKSTRIITPAAMIELLKDK
jgi:predicted nucleic acid-binding protein